MINLSDNVFIDAWINVGNTASIEISSVVRDKAALIKENFPLIWEYIMEQLMNDLDDHNLREGLNENT